MDRIYKASLTGSMLLAALVAGACGGKDDAKAAPEATKAPAAQAAPAMPAGTVIQAESLEKGATAMKGQTVRVNGVTVASNLGAKAFWFTLPNKNPFLVMTADSGSVKAQTVVDVVGKVNVMNDSIMKAWVSSGAITENQKLEAEFATEFIQAAAVQKSKGGAMAPAAGAMGASGAAAPAKK